MSLSRRARLGRYGTVAAALAPLSDRRLAALVARATPVGTGIGGDSARLDVEGVPVFVKRIPLTDLERRPEHVMSTANLFGLPAYCHYGVGGPGFGAWRELAANAMTTGWALAGRTGAFPLMYHWRVLPGAPPPAEEHADVDATVAYWHGSPAVRERLEALAKASASVVLFLEHVPLNLYEWLGARLDAGEVVPAVTMVARRLPAAAGFMNANGLLHFDTHFRNVLTDGHRLYLADLGLVATGRFELSGDEAEFLARNRGHDRAYAVMQLVNWLVTKLVAPPDVASRNEYIRRCAAGVVPEGVPAPVAGIISRYAPVTAVMNDFYWDLFGVSRQTPYPAEAVEAAYRA